MAKKNTPSKSAPKKSVSRSAVPVSTPVRNSAIPPKAATKKLAPAPSYSQIAKRAYEISQSGLCGSEDDNWFRAERELRGL